MDINNDTLLQMCQTRPQAKRDNRIEIYLFDRDVPRYIQKAAEKDKSYKHWEANVYSALLPVPEHRDFNEICIEHFYPDEDLLKEDKNGRRLYTTKEFDPDSGCHLKLKEVYYANRRDQLRCKYPKILDSNVRKNGSDENIALSKNNFAKNIFHKTGSFKEVSFSYFKVIFELFEEIMAQAK